MSHQSEAARILIVEDEGIIALRIEEVIEELGHTVAGIAASYEDVVALRAGRRPDLALLDVSIHGQRDGIEVAEAVRQLWDLPVIFMTAHADCSTLDRMTAMNPFGFVVKPFSADDIRAAVDGALQRIAAEQVERGGNAAFVLR